MDDFDKKIKLVQELEQKKNCIEEAVFEAKSKKLALEFSVIIIQKERR